MKTTEKVIYWKHLHVWYDDSKGYQWSIATCWQIGTDLLLKAFKENVKNLMLALTRLNQVEKFPVGYKHIDCHMILNIKLDFIQKAQFMAWGHVLDAHGLLTHFSMVSWESVRISLIMASLIQAWYFCFKFWCCTSLFYLDIVYHWRTGVWVYCWETYFFI